MEIITIEDFKANTKEWLIDKLESMSKDDALQSICNIHDKLHNYEYPKTYEECCKTLNIPANGDIVYAGNWTYGGEYLDKHLDTIRKFQQLLICRDAYWKIAGEQMGSSKSFEPNWRNGLTKFCISKCEDQIMKYTCTYANYILIFPTEEMRDAFFDYFKKLIELCKEWL